MDLLIESDGTKNHTVITGPGGVPLAGVTAIDYHLDGHSIVGEVRLTFALAELKVRGELVLTREHADEILKVAEAIRAGQVRVIEESADIAIGCDEPLEDWQHGLAEYDAQHSAPKDEA